MKAQERKLFCCVLISGTLRSIASAKVDQSCLKRSVFSNTSCVVKSTSPHKPEALGLRKRVSRSEERRELTLPLIFTCTFSLKR